MLPWRRRQPSGGAARAEAVFSDQGGGGHRGGASGAPWWLGRSCHPTRLASQLAAQQCTQVPQNRAERPFSPICVHSCVPSPVHNGATVYTSAPKRIREASFADLCTLLRRRLAVTPHHAARIVTQPPTHTNSRSPISVPHFWLLHYDQGPLLPIARGAGPVSDSIKGRSLVAVSLVWRSAYLV